MRERAPVAKDDEGSGPRIVDEEVRRRDREILDALTAHLPRRAMTERDREVFAEYRRRKAAGERGISLEERADRRAARTK